MPARAQANGIGVAHAPIYEVTEEFSQRTPHSSRSSPAECRGSQVPRIARIDSRSDDVVASTADGSYPQCAMQFEHRGSLPRP